MRHESLRSRDRLRHQKSNNRQLFACHQGLRDIEAAPQLMMRELSYHSQDYLPSVSTTKARAKSRPKIEFILIKLGPTVNPKNISTNIGSNNGIAPRNRSRRRICPRPILELWIRKDPVIGPFFSEMLRPLQGFGEFRGIQPFAYLVI